jgi:density-regulated protein DRP1
VQLKRQDRSKRKHVTVVVNLQAHDIELKKAAKLFANKFACGSSVVKNPQGLEEIVIQGDVSDQLLDFIPATWPHAYLFLADRRV